MPFVLLPQLQRKNFTVLCFSPGPPTRARDVKKTVWVTIQKEWGRRSRLREQTGKICIAFKLQEEEKRRGNYVPEVSVLVQLPEVDLDATEEMLRPLV